MSKYTEEKYIPALSFNFSRRVTIQPLNLQRASAFKSKLVRQIEVPANGRLLDLGCGTATLTIAIKRKFSRSEFHGVDGDVKILEIARYKASRSSTKINFTEAFSTKLPYLDEYFDAVASSLFSIT